MDILKRVEETLERGMSASVEFPDVPGFVVDVAFVGRDEMLKIYGKYTKTKYSRKLKHDEQITRKEPLLREWADRAIKSWVGLTLGGLSTLIPLDLKPGEDPKAVVDPSTDVKVALLKHNADFDRFVMNLATDLTAFEAERKDIKDEVENLE